ncbi:dimethylamine monooxygenase subunit DmmA family protein [Bacillus marinisedimentorum]|uniref:dimethylamine monooxygenase subunit DmmA family protein n=1 Tax=Bacillus marinisedimentorum TaxID=1821260 RepID=UPI0008723F53|nr:dimethylamine monooxygenase subunit DmmA family protein [Bacillus marinisedimentorum]
MSQVQAELSLKKGKRKYLFCADEKGAEVLNALIPQAEEEHVPFEIKTIGHESDSSLNHWFSQQKMGTYLYVSGTQGFVNRIQKLALEAGFSEQEMQVNVLGAIKKQVICSKCHGVNEAEDEQNITCSQCGIELEVSSHFSRRLGGYLGYTTI